MNAGVSNAILNGLFFYLLNAETDAIPFASVLVDTLLTCGFVSGLVTWPTTYFTRKAVHAGLPVMERYHWIDCLPRRWPLLWLTLWASSGLFAAFLTWLGFRLCGFSSIAFTPMLIVKCVSLGLLGGVLGALVAARYLQPAAVKIPLGSQ